MECCKICWGSFINTNDKSIIHPFACSKCPRRLNDIFTYRQHIKNHGLSPPTYTFDGDTRDLTEIW